MPCHIYIGKSFIEEERGCVAVHDCGVCSGLSARKIYLDILGGSTERSEPKMIAPWRAKWRCNSDFVVSSLSNAFNFSDKDGLICKVVYFAGYWMSGCFDGRHECCRIVQRLSRLYCQGKEWKKMREGTNCSKLFKYPIWGNNAVESGTQSAETEICFQVTPMLCNKNPFDQHHGIPTISISSIPLVWHACCDLSTSVRTRRCSNLILLSNSAEPPTCSE